MSATIPEIVYSWMLVDDKLQEPSTAGAYVGELQLV